METPTTTNKKTYTAGPWKQFAKHNKATHLKMDNTYRSIYAGHGFYSKKVHGSGFEITGFISPEDAALMAAAPDMLEALVSVESSLANQTITSLEIFTPLLNSVRAAIQKATKL